MNKKVGFFIGILVTVFSGVSAADSSPLMLSGKELTVEDVVRVSQEPIQVVIDAKALSRVRRSHKVLLQAAQEGKPVYGLNRGVGLNKDKTIFKGNTLDPEAKEASENFNRNILYSHSAAIEPELSKKIVFPVMLIRLNMMLRGQTGVHPDVVMLLAEFINKRIYSYPKPWIYGRR